MEIKISFFFHSTDTSYEKACGERRGSAPVTPVLPTANPAHANGFAPRNSMDSSTPSRFAVSFLLFLRYRTALTWNFVTQLPITTASSAHVLYRPRTITTQIAVFVAHIDVGAENRVYTFPINSRGGSLDFWKIYFPKRLAYTSRASLNLCISFFRPLPHAYSHRRTSRFAQHLFFPVVAGRSVNVKIVSRLRRH